MIEEITAFKTVIDGIRTATALSRELLGSNLSQDEMREKLYEVRDQLMGAQGEALNLQTQQAELVNRIRSLEQELDRLQRWSVQAENYELKCIDDIAFVYALKKDLEYSEPAHWLCQVCFENSKKSIFQFFGVEMGYKLWLCPSCKCRVQTHPRTEPSYS